jgi:hypothetical protein
MATSTKSPKRPGKAQPTPQTQAQARPTDAELRRSQRLRAEDGARAEAFEAKAKATGSGATLKPTGRGAETIAQPDGTIERYQDGQLVNTTPPKSHGTAPAAKDKPAKKSPTPQPPQAPASVREAMRTTGNAEHFLSLPSAAAATSGASSLATRTTWARASSSRTTAATTLSASINAGGRVPVPCG